MPFGLQLKSLIVGYLLAWLAVPYLLAFLNNRRAAPPTQ